MKMIVMAVDGQGLVHLAATRAPDLWRRELSRSTGSAHLAFVGLAPAQLNPETVIDRVARRLARQAARGQRPHLAGGGDAEIAHPAEASTGSAKGAAGVPRALVYSLAPDRILRALHWELGGALRIAALARSAGWAKRRLVRALTRLAHALRRREHVVRRLTEPRRG